MTTADMRTEVLVPVSTEIVGEIEEAFPGISVREAAAILLKFGIRSYKILKRRDSK